MTTTTMNAMHGSLHGNRTSNKLSLATAKFLEQRASLPEMPELESHAAAFASVAIKLAAAAVPVSTLVWLAVAG